MVSMLKVALEQSRAVSTKHTVPSSALDDILEMAKPGDGPTIVEAEVREVFSAGLRYFMLNDAPPNPDGLLPHPYDVSVARDAFRDSVLEYFQENPATGRAL